MKLSMASLSHTLPSHTVTHALSIIIIIIMKEKGSSSKPWVAVIFTF